MRNANRSQVLALTLSRLAAGLVVALAFLAAPPSVSAQYFGRNKVQYDAFDFRVMKTDHFDIYFYPEEATAVEDAARMSERWYERYARAFQHEFERSKPIILYADHPDFQQTNTLSGFVSEGTGGVTESLKNRVILPLTGSYRDNDHVIGHELVHAFQYNIAQARRGGGLQGLGSLPLWLIEGMAEYMSLGRDDPLTAMWIRDAIRRDDLPTIRQMTTETRYFPYRFGQALWAYIGGTFGDDAVVQIYRRALRVGFEQAIRQVLGMPTDTLSIEWKQEAEKEYGPLMEGRDDPADEATLLLSPATGAGRQNVSPSVSPDGKYLAFLSEKDLFSVDLYLADATTGKILRKLTSANADPHADAIRYIDSSGTWSPDGKYFAFVIVADGNNELVIVETKNGRRYRRVAFDGIGAIQQPAWSPDGRYIAFSGSVGGISDLFVYDLESDATRRLTDDKYGDFQPAWSPDGTTIAFTSDRGPETNFDLLSYSQYQLALIDVASKQVRVLPVFGNVKHMNPQYAPDGESLYFISDQDGVSDLYRLDFRRGDVQRLTHLKTGVSGITSMSPAMTVASRTGRIVYSVFDAREFHIYAMEPDVSGAAVALVDHPEDQPGRKLPPAKPARFSRVGTYLADAETGLKPPGSYSTDESGRYQSSLALDYVGQPTLGVGTDRFGNYIGGGAAAYFSDMLGNHVLGTSFQAQGTLKDIGGQAFYADLSRRWNWALGAGRIPYLLGFFGVGQDSPEEGGRTYLGQTRYRIFVTTATAQASYPFSTTQRFETHLGLTRYSYDIELDKFYLDQFGRPVDFARVSRNDLAPEPLNLVEGGVALVGDNAFFGFVSPVRGGRYRLGVDRTQGTLNFTTVTADYRRYFAPSKNLTIGFRALHLGRYGVGSQGSSNQAFGALQPFFLGFETLIRGYAFESFQSNECGASSAGPGNPGSSGCPPYDRLWGQRIAVTNLELRVPFIGVERYGIINFPFLPTELVAFVDGGLAWDGDHPATLKFSRNSPDRIPVFSTGFSARMNILGIMVLEAYYAYPFQRPIKGWHWGFVIAPGW